MMGHVCRLLLLTSRRGDRSRPQREVIGIRTAHIREGSKVLFVRRGKALEGRVFAVHEGAYSVEAPGNRAYYLDWWEILLVLDFDEAYAEWLADPLAADA